MANGGESRSSRTCQRLLEWNRELPRAVDTFAHCLLEAQSVQHPESPAVCSWDGDLTYAELDAYSSHLASYLATQGVEPEVIVPLCFEKSRWAIVSLLAVLKAGGAFLLLDPSQPKARLESIVRQTGSTFALSSAICLDTCKTLVDQAFVVDASIFLNLERSLPPSSLKLNNAAYYIFTSGSTGSPKGVVIEHSQLSTTSTNIGRQLGYDRESRVFQFASYAFDACITDIFGTLTSGGTLCIPSEWERNNGIVESMRRMKVTSAKFTPSLASNLVIESVPTLTTLVLGGESPPASLVEQWAPRLRLILVYGPTECCVICFTSDASDHKISPGEIGRPVGARAWIVKQDDHNKLAEIGEIGELLIEGPLVGRGYLNDQAKTDQQFIQNPTWMPVLFGSGQGKNYRLYKTGDLARYLEDGRVCYAGRIDNQVKIRGQRLELEEVEKKLHECLVDLGGWESKQVVVEAVQLSGLTTRQLVAFLCLETPEPIGRLEWDTENENAPNLLTSTAEQERFSKMVSEIEAMLKVVLPAYAIPSIWIPLSIIPFTISKKADRKRLRAIVSPLSTKTLHVFTNIKQSLLRSEPAQSTKTESKLQKLWADAFSLEPSAIELDDNFFSIGGDSVLAIKLIAAARADGLDLSLQIIFESPVLCEMARVTRVFTIREEDLAAVPPFSLLDSTFDIRVVRWEAGRECSIDKDCIEDIYPCSPMQEGLLALSLKDAGTYILQFVYQMPNSIDLDKLQAAWEAVARRTHVLRTRFFDCQSDLLQVVVNEPLKWTVIDGDLADFLVQEKDRKMNFGEQMSRHTVLRQRGSLQYFLVWNVHHALVDGWSESDIINSVEQEYLGNSPANLAAPMFNSFIKHIRQQDEESGREFWTQQLAGAPSAVFPKLPDPGYIPKVQRSNRISHHLDAHAEAELEHKIPLFKKGSATPATMIQAAWFLLIGLYSSNASDVVTGVTLNGRTAQLPGIDQIPGPTVTTVPFRARFSPDQKLSDFLQTIQKQYLSILPFAQYGLQNIRRLNEDAVAACRFRSLLVVQSANRPQSSRKLLLGRSYSFPVMDFAIVMECELQDGGIEFRATFDHQILSEVQVQRMFRQMEDILQRMSSSDASTKVSDLQKISQADMLEIFQWNSTPDVFKSTRSCVHQLIESRTRMQGSSLAICSWDGELSYTNLDDYSSRLAAHLQKHYHIKPESLVMTCFENSLWAVVSMLAVLKAGGACVPMNPNSPKRDLQMRIRKLGKRNANILLTSSLHIERLNNLGSKIIKVDANLIEELVDIGPVGNKATPTNAAFVFFTSGSTGSPKGVVLEHQAISSGALNWSQLFQQDKKSRVLQYSAYTHHICLGDIFSTLIHGGCVCIPSEHDRLNNLSEAIESFNADQITLTPSLVHTLRPEKAPSLKVLITSGEVLTKPIIENWAGSVTLINAYGLTECALFCSTKAGIQRKKDYNNIGRSVGCLTWIVDPEDPDNLTPIGGVGEVLIEGPILARGYIEDDLQTKSALIEEPAWSRSEGAIGRRFFKTGDVASYQSDGSLEFVGRLNRQVELHGRRVNVTEVEHQLRDSIPKSTGVAVAVVHPKDGDKILAAFLVVYGDEVKTTKETTIVNSPKALEQFQKLVEGLTTKLRSNLDNYMVPSLYIPIDKLPLSSAGKIDRKVLERLASELSSSELINLRGDLMSTKTSKPPSTRMEKRISLLWKTLLQVDDIGVDDDFFQLGGGSVLAMRLVSMARREGISMTVSGIFQSPKLKDLALTVHENVNTTDIAPFALVRNQSIADLHRQTILQCGVSMEEIEDIYPLTAMQMHYITGYPEAKRDLSGPWCWQSQVVYSLPTTINLEKFKAVWNAAVRRHPALRARVINTPAGIFQVVLKEAEVLEWREASDLKRYLQDDISDNMNFGDRLLRLAIIESENPHKRFFVMTAQHLLYDAFARSMLFKELEIAYTQENLPSSTAPLPKMNHFVKYITEADKSDATEFWTSYLSGANTKPLLRIPEDRTIFDITEKTITTQLDTVQGWTDKLQSALPTMIEIASGLALAHRLDCSDVIFYSDRSGRNLPVDGIQDIIGPTTLFLPVRIHVSRNQKIKDLLQQSQKFKSTMMPFEHLDWLELREMPHIQATDIRKHALNVNINPHPLAVLGPALGLEFKGSHALCDDPFGINVDLYAAGKMEWLVYFDEVCIEEEVVDELLSEIERVFRRLVSVAAGLNGEGELCVGKLLDELDSLE